MLRLQSKQTTSYRQPASPVSRRRSVWPGRLFLVSILVLVGGIFWQRQAISDWIQLYGYAPTATISTLATETTMTGAAQHLFYLNKPQISDKAQFSNHCTNQEKTIVLGCYHGGQNGIYILKIADNSELNGVMQVTAAHEMLHAAYDRLSADDRTNINAQLQAYFDNSLHDKAIRAEVNAYRKTEPGELLNEMHSIFGTEVANLPSGLETYYARYFASRKSVVVQAERYQSAFRKHESAVAKYDVQIAVLQKQIKSGESLLQTNAADLKSALSRLNALKSANKIDSYNVAVPGYNSLVRSYNALLETTRDQILQFNILVTKRNALVVEEQQLIKQLSGEDLPTAR